MKENSWLFGRFQHNILVSWSDADLGHLDSGSYNLDKESVKLGGNGDVGELLAGLGCSRARTRDC